MFCQITSHHRHKKLMAHTGVSRADTVTTEPVNPMTRQRRVDRRISVTSMAAANKRGEWLFLAFVTENSSFHFEHMISDRQVQQAVQPHRSQHADDQGTFSQRQYTPGKIRADSAV